MVCSSPGATVILPGEPPHRWKAIAMPLSPEEIEKKQFLVALRGYDKDQVDAFLQQVSEEHRSLLYSFDSTQRDGAIALPEVDCLDEVGIQITALLKAARVSAEEIRRAAEAEVAGEYAEARRALDAARVVREEADRLRSEAEAECSVLTREARSEIERAAQKRLDAEKQAMHRLAEASREAADLQAAAQRTYEEAALAFQVADEELQAAIELRTEADSTSGESPV